jgi:hypothetical protein
MTVLTSTNTNSPSSLIVQPQADLTHPCQKVKACSSACLTQVCCSIPLTVGCAIGVVLGGASAVALKVRLSIAACTPPVLVNPSQTVTK